jgi:hypothetical protein
VNNKPFPKLQTARQNLSQFSNKSVRKQRKYDKLTDKNEAKLDKASYESQNLREDLISQKKAIFAERSAVIKSEYGSIENYNKVKKQKDFVKSEKLSEIDKKYSDLSGNVNSHTAKLKAFNSEKNGINEERGSLYTSRKKREKSEVKEYKNRLKTAKDSENKLEIKAAEYDYKLAKSQSKLPAQRVIRKTYTFDEKSGKVKSRLKIEKEVKPIDGRSGIVTKGIKGGANIVKNTA